MKKLFLLIMFILFLGCFKEEKVLDQGDGVSLSRSGDLVYVSAEGLLGAELKVNKLLSEDELSSEGLIIVKAEEEETRILLTNTGSNLLVIKSEEAIEISLVNGIKTLEDTDKRVNGTDTLLGDFNADDTVDILDFALFTENYGGEGESFDIYPSSLGSGDWEGTYSLKTGDDLVNLYDFIIFGKNYGKNAPIEEVKDRTYAIVDTGVEDYYSNNAVITEPRSTETYYGQDANYKINEPSYTNNGDGTITDNVTGLMWQQDMGEKITFADAETKANSLNLGGHNDWRVPTIKELYSLILFTGSVQGETAIEYFIDTDYFNQPLGDLANGEREIDAQTWSSTEYVGRTMNGDETVFGVNFVDGRIKGYPKYNPQTKAGKTMYFRMVRGNTSYGKNNFVDNGDGTISDLATGLMWQKSDSAKGLDWKEALDYAENLDLAEHNDWRLPNAKELQSIVDYTKSLQTTNSPAIDEGFETSSILDPGGVKNYPYFWTSTTHLDGIVPESGAVYIAFGEAQGEMNGNLLDVHGAGAQRSDPKSGEASDYPQYFGPQGDVRYVYNYVRAVRNID